MKIKMLIATADSDYAEHLSNMLSEKYVDTFEVSVCSSAERLQGMLSANKYDAMLLEPGFAGHVDLGSVHLALILVDETGAVTDSGISSLTSATGGADSTSATGGAGASGVSLRRLRKYQRISMIAGSILENYAEVGKGMTGFGESRARIAAVWSPTGGSGKTTIALAYAAHKVAAGKKVIYLNLENFSSAPAYFAESGKSISKVFEKLESNAQMLLMGIRQQDSSSGIMYFSGPENYDDMNILTPNDIEKLVAACAAEIDELVIDLSSQCDDRIKRVFDLADLVFIISDPSSTSQTKLRQFVNQHNIFRQIQLKSVLVNNKGARVAEANINKAIQLPLLHSADQVSIYKTLSNGNFDW